MSEGDTQFPVVPGRSVMPEWYPELLDSVTSLVATGHRRAVAAVNTELLSTYWSIGRQILDRQDADGWGANVIDRLSADLRERFPDTRGYSVRNLRYMRTFAGTWDQAAILQAPLADLPWYHQLALMQKLDEPEARLWYASAAVENGWSRDVLALQIDNGLRERSGQAISNFHDTLPGPDSDLAQQSTKDPYVFDFLSLTEARRERDVEGALIQHIGRFLLELGRGFAFVGRQVRLELAGDEFFCDLLFYHIRLRRYVVIELKASAFRPEFLGQLGMYQAAVDDLLAEQSETPTIGLLLCRTKNDVVVEYALRGHASPVGVAEWQTDVTTTLPEELAGSLPTVEELEAELATEPWEDES